MKKFFALALTAALVVVDQLIKNWAFKNLLPVKYISVIDGFFHLTYVENRGAAFGILNNHTILLSVVSGTLLLVIIIALLMGKFKTDFMLWTVSVGLAGGIGNLYDRIFCGFVVDYLDFSALFGFPVFNFADCCVVCATFLILIYFIKNDTKQTVSASEEEAR